MSAGGLLFMALSWGVIIALNVFCFHRLWRDQHGARRPD